MTEVRFPISVLETMPRPSEYMVEMRQCAIVETDKEMVFDKDSPCYRALKEKYKNHTQVASIPQNRPCKNCGNKADTATFVDAGELAGYSGYSEILKEQLPVEALTEEERIGLGDLVESGAKLIGADKLAAWYESVLGKSCGCNARKKFLNRIRLWKKVTQE